MSETRTYQGHTYTRNGPGEPWTMVGPAAPQSYGTPDPTQPLKVPLAQADLAAKGQEAELRRIAIDKAKRDLANTPEADLSPEVLANITAGKPVRLQDLPAGAQGIVSGLLQGNLPAGQRSIASKSMLPYIKMAMSVDPGFSANTFAARQKATGQLADMKSTGGYLSSLTANIDHSREEEAAINRLGNPGGLIGRWGGAALNNWLFNKGGPAESQFNQANRTYAGEQVKSITGSAGSAGANSALADRQEAEKAITASMPYDAQIAALRTGAIQNYQKYRDVNQSYRRTMGTDIPDAMTPEQAQQLLHLMRMKDDGTEGDIPEGVDPGFIALASSAGNQGGGPGGGGSNPGGPPPAFSGPPPLRGVGINNGFRGVDPRTLGGAAEGYADPGAESIGTLYKSVPNPLKTKAYSELISFLNGNPNATEGQVRTFLSRNPIYPAGYADTLVAYHNKTKRWAASPGDLNDQVPLTDSEKTYNRVFGGPEATGVISAANAASFGIPELAAAFISPDAERKLSVMRGENPKSAILGDVVGSLAGLKGAQLATKAMLPKITDPLVARGFMGAERAAKLVAPVSEGVYGGVTGAASNPEHPVLGAAFGAVATPFAGGAGRTLGQYVAEPVVRGMGRLAGVGMPKPNPIDRTVTAAVGRGNLGDIQGSLSEAAGLNLPMTLADVNPGLRSLAGASVRRSPNASGLAEDALLPRGRGQIDRFQSAIERDLGPTSNIPQLTDDMMTAARTKAAPLYDEAYAQPPVTSPKLSAILETPFGQDALRRAVNIAKNERVDPNTLSIDFNDVGDPVLRGTPSMRTLDLVKRGMDDVLETYRDKTTGVTSFDEAGLAQLGAKKDFLGELDRLNPKYGEARSAFAGPAQETDQIRFGQRSFNQPPDTLTYDMSKLAPSKLPFRQLGYRDALSQAGNRAGYSSNPFDRTLGTPAAESRLQSMYPNNPGNANLLRQRDLERTMQATSNDILGNSKTAQRGIADEAFAGENLPQLGLDLGLNLMTGQVPIGTMMKANLGRRLGDAYKLGVGKRAVAKADALAPMLLNPNPAAASDELAAAFARMQSYSDYIARRRGVFGAPIGAAGAGLLSGLANQ